MLVLFQALYLRMPLLQKHPYIPAITFLVISMILLTLPGDSLPKAQWMDIPYFDKWIHITLFTTLCFLFAFPLKYQPIPDSRKKLWIWIISLLGICYGTAIEFVQQYWIANRSFELLDIGADTIGSLLALIISYQVLLKQKVNRPS